MTDLDTRTPGEKNYDEWIEFFKTFKRMVRRFNEEELEEFIQYSKEHTYVEDEERYRKQIDEIRNTSDEDSDE